MNRRDTFCDHLNGIPFARIASMRITVLCAFALLIATAAAASVVEPPGGAPQVLVPAAGNTPGLNGAYFRSDITILDVRVPPRPNQLVSLQWLPRPGVPVPAPVTIHLSPPGQAPAIRSVDFVDRYLHQTGLGAILITALNVDGSGIDPTGRLYVVSRIWSPQPGTNGVTSQSLPALATAQINTPSATIFALGGTDDPFAGGFDSSLNYRVNVGIVNLDPNNTQSFTVHWDPNCLAPPFVGIQVTLPPLTMTQVPAGTPCPRWSGIGITNVTPSATRSNLWTAYGSTINNTTGNAWSELALPTPVSP